MSISNEEKRPSIPALLLVLAIIAVALGASAGPTSSASAEANRRITLPIHRDSLDDVRWSDTYGAARGGGRSHLGVDMLGPKMVPLVAARSGVISWGRFDNSRGSIVRIRDDEGWEYQYIHFNNDTPGTDDGLASCSQVFSVRLCGAINGNGDFATQLRVSEGEIIGYMGDGGNAEWTASHLHFEVYQPGTSGAVSVNPTPLVDAARLRILNGVGSGPPPAAAPGQNGFADHLWYRVHGRYPSSAERNTFQAEASAKGVWLALAAEVDERSTVSMIDRLYLAFFRRYPDTDGINYWVRTRAAGYGMEEIAEWFAESDEYRTRYAGTTFDQFLDQLYTDVLHRAPDAQGKRYWLDRLRAGDVTRGTIVIYFTESAEMQGIAVHRNEIVALNLIKDGSVPTTAEVAAWEALRSTRSTADALAQWYGP